MEETIGGVKNYNIAVKKHGDEITFLRRIVRGGADDSFGIEVAKLAGVPEPVIRRAKKILKEMESDTAAGKPTVPRSEKEADDGQLTMVPAAQNEILETLKTIDPNVLSPIEAMQIYSEMQIGTARPTEEEMRGVPHHLTGFLPLSQPYSVARFVEDASRCAAEIFSRGRLPVLAGGTGLYVSSLVNGVSFAEEPHGGLCSTFPLHALHLQ